MKAIFASVVSLARKAIGKFYRRLPFKLGDRIQYLGGNMQDVRVIDTLDELDEILRKLDRAAEISDDELRKQFKTFHMEFDTRVPEDPYSQEYRNRQFELYARIAGKNYSISNEVSAFDIDKATVRPFPYYTESCETVGYHLMAVANIIHLMKLRKGSTIVEPSVPIIVRHLPPYKLE